MEVERVVEVRETPVEVGERERVRELLKFLGKRRIFEKRWLRKRA